MSKVYSSPESQRPLWGVVCAGVALTSSAALILVVALARLFAVRAIMPDFALLACPLAFAGLAAGGLASYWLAAPGPGMYRRVGCYAALNALITLLVLAGVLYLNPASVSSTALVAILFTSALPFVCGGLALAPAIAATAERVERIWFWLLIGAATGCLLLLPLMALTGAPGAAIAAAMLAAAAAAVWFGIGRSPRGRALGVALSLALMTLLVYNKQAQFLSLEHNSGRRIFDELLAQWLGLLNSRGAGQSAASAPQLALGIGAATALAAFSLPALRTELRAAALRLRWVLLYFALLGAGFTLILASLLRNLGRLLDHPGQALMAAIWPLLLAAAVGAYTSRRACGLNTARRYDLLFSRPIMMGVWFILSSNLLAGQTGAPASAVRIVGAVCLAALASLLAGSLPPVVLSLVREREPAAIPWAWALHAAAATLAVALAGVASPLAALAAGAACCLAAALLMRWVEANRASN